MESWKLEKAKKTFEAMESNRRRKASGGRLVRLLRKLEVPALVINSSDTPVGATIDVMGEGIKPNQVIQIIHNKVEGRPLGTDLPQ